jgi:predicted O-methyltransferase YrrM
MKNPLNLVKKANRSFNLYLENFGKYQKVISDYYKNQEVFNNFLADYHKRKDSKVNERLYKEFEEEQRLYKEKTVKQMPSIPLKQENINNTKFLLNREDLLEKLTKEGVCAEIGVASGDFSQLILQKIRPKKLHLIDAWHSERYDDSLESLVRQKFSREIELKQVILNKGLSTEVLPEFEDNYFDWVYIDTVHDYRTTAQELAICREKVKDGGIIAGHDFSMGNWINGYKYGVINAVYEFCRKYGWEMLYITSELVEKSFAIRELK